jgi:hypothetical protein
MIYYKKTHTISFRKNIIWYLFLKRISELSEGVEQMNKFTENYFNKKRPLINKWFLFIGFITIIKKFFKKIFVFSLKFYIVLLWVLLFISNKFF